VTSATDEPAGASPAPPAPGPEPPWWRGRATNGRSRPPLSREAIVDAAVRIVDAEGVDALTIRRLGEELGTGAATLYWHISGKDELGELVYDRIMGEVELPEPDPVHWQEQLKDLGLQAFRVMRKHRDAARLSLGHVPVGPNMLRVIEWSLGLMRAAGIPDAPAAYFGDIFGRFLDASVLEDTAGPSRHTSDDDDRASIDMIGQHFASLPADQFPNIVALSSVMFGATDDERFEFGLDVLMRGLSAYAR